MGDGLRVIVCGTREGVRPDVLAVTLATVVRLHGPIATIVQGGARGVDAQAADWARRNGVRVEEHPANWELHGKSAGPIRNREMARLGANLCVCFPGAGPGTWDMVDVVARHRIPRWVIEAPKKWTREKGDG